MQLQSFQNYCKTGQFDLMNHFLPTTLIYFVLLFIISHDTQPTLAAVGECNFEKYATGCFSQANFICDKYTNHCKCHPEFPVLIEGRICYKRAKACEKCDYNQQCDNENGFYCMIGDNRNVNNCSQPQESARDHREQHPRCYKLQRHKHKLPPTPLKQDQNSSTTSSKLPRLIWIFLLASLIGLIVLLLLIKSQYYRIGRPFQHEDRLSLSSDRRSSNDRRSLGELDIPPPYEIAIRMKQ